MQACGVSAIAVTNTIICLLYTSIVYFNEFTGGIDGAYGHYETDYYMNSIKQAFFKLAKEKDLYNTKDSVSVSYTHLDVYKRQVRF